MENITWTEMPKTHQEHYKIVSFEIPVENNTLRKAFEFFAILTLAPVALSWVLTIMAAVTIGTPQLKDVVQPGLVTHTKPILSYFVVLTSSYREEEDKTESGPSSICSPHWSLPSVQELQVGKYS